MINDSLSVLVTGLWLSVVELIRLGMRPCLQADVDSLLTVIMMALNAFDRMPTEFNEAVSLLFNGDQWI
jgi:hypothetical protein